MKGLSSRRLIQLAIGLGITVLALLPLTFYTPPQTVEAQCGSSASSCKTCHEVQGEDPVNDSGEWHTAHAFGDFCEFCHAGNVQAKTKDEAHQGLVDPLGDVQASCQSCHPDDYQARAQTYADILGVTLGAGGGATAGAATTVTGTVTGTVAGPTAGGDVVQGATLDLSQVTAPGAMVVDYNELYSGGGEPKAPQEINWGNIAFLVIDLILLIALILVVAYREHLVARFQHMRQVRFEPGMSLNAALAGGGQMTMAAYAEAGVSPEVAAENQALMRILPRLANASPVVLAALDQLLDNEEVAEDILVALTNVDLRLVEEFKSLNQKDRELLLALANDMS